VTDPQAPAPTSPSRLATASLVCGLLGLSVLPILGGLVAAGLGSAALVEMRRRPDELTGRGQALAGVGLGLAGGIVPLTVILAVVARNHAAAWPAAAVVAGAALAVIAIAVWASGTGPARGKAVGVTLGAAAGGLVAIGLGVLAIIGVGLLFYLLGKTILVAIGHAIGDGFSKVIHGNHKSR
jgi:uncharacterized protein DUF4190